jgi:adenine-specific DNA methylase
LSGRPGTWARAQPLLEEDFAEFRREGSCKDEEELVFDPMRGKDAEFYRQELTQAFARAAAALKPEGLFVLVFRHREERAWGVLRSALAEAGLEIIKEWLLDLENYPQPQARSRVKARSAVLVCRRAADLARAHNSLICSIYNVKQLT